MALRVLDGNQTATTLSSVVTGGEHIVAHSVVSLGANAISNIASAVSGSVVSISNFPSTQTVAGTVTANGVWEEDNLRPSVRGENDAPPTFGIGIAINKNGSETGIVGINNPLPISGTVTANIGSEYYSGQSGVTYSLSLQSFTDGGEIFAVGLDDPLPVKIISGSVTVGNSITIGSLPAISGTVTANVFGLNPQGLIKAIPVAEAGDGQAEIGIPVVANLGGAPQVIGDNYPLPISGTVTANATILNSAPDYIKVIAEGNDLAYGVYYLQRYSDRIWKSNLQSVNVVIYFDENSNEWRCTEEANNNDIASAGGDRNSIPPLSGWTLGSQGNFFEIYYENPLKREVFGTVTANVQSLPIIFSIANVGTLGAGNFITDDGGLANDLGIGIAYNTDITDPSLAQIVSETAPLPVQVLGGSVTIGSLPAISGTVTANSSNGLLTTRFGTPTTANVSFATSAVTNANRKYLLIQNVTTGSNVITVGVGFTPTTTQGIQLTAGAGITFESSYIPTGAVYVLSSVTASNFTILEA